MNARRLGVPLRRDLLHIRVDELQQRIDRRFGERHPGCGERGIGLTAAHMLGQLHVDIEIQCDDGLTNHFRQRVAKHALHLTDRIRGAKHFLRPFTTHPAVNEFREIVTQHEVHKENRIRHLISIFTYDGMDFSIGRTRLGSYSINSQIFRFFFLVGLLLHDSS